MEMVFLPLAEKIEVGAHCSLEGPELRERLAAWARLRDRAQEVTPTERGALLHLAVDEPLDELGRLVELEAECCPFYRFAITVDGTGRTLEVDAGPGYGAAVHALLRLGEAVPPA